MPLLTNEFYARLNLMYRQPSKDVNTHDRECAHIGARKGGFPTHARIYLEEGTHDLEWSDEVPAQVAFKYYFGAAEGGRYLLCWIKGW